jgi:thiaminase
VQQLADGTLPVERFKHYLIQDYLFLVSSYESALRKQLTDADTLRARKCIGCIQVQEHGRYWQSTLIDFIHKITLIPY